MFYFGVDYYPEQWPEERWPIDAKLMAEAKFNVVRLAEFAWARMEPTEGSFDFEWLDRAIEILGKYDIKIILGTPTASAPPWVMQKSPDLYRVREDGQRVTFGNRRAYCPNQPLYQECVRRIVTAMADHYASHPKVIGWQIDNEFGDRCYCPTCQKKFQEWLRGRYEDLDDLNQKWGTVFWSHTYSDWGEIPTPSATGSSPNPALALDYFRFCSETYVNFQELQVDILKTICPGHFVTHNLMGFGYDRINYFDLGRGLDFVSLDIYPRSQWSTDSCIDPSELALNHATLRGLKKQNFWVMEQQSGAGGWEMISMAPRPGEMRLWAYQSIAHGADGILFFRWRSARYGAEQYWHGLLDHDAYPGRRYDEAKQMGKELQRIGDLIHGSEVRSQVAMILSYDSRFSFEIQPNNPLFSYAQHFKQIYRVFHQGGIPVDIIPPHCDLSPYRLVIAPALHVLPEGCAQALTQYVRAGGTLLVTQRSGVKDEANAIVNQRLPGYLAEVCGVEVVEYDSLSRTRQNRLEFALPEFSGKEMPMVGVLCEILKPTTAKVLACYAEDFYAGKPAITWNRVGKGQAVYAGALGDQSLYGTLISWLLEKIEIKSALAQCEGVEVTERWQEGRQLVFILNHNDCQKTIHLDKSYSNLLNDMTYTGEVQLEPHGVLILTLC